LDTYFVVTLWGLTNHVSQSVTEEEEEEEI
jgi:hypothetical protein